MAATSVNRNGRDKPAAVDSEAVKRARRDRRRSGTFQRTVNGGIGRSLVLRPCPPDRDRESGFRRPPTGDDGVTNMSIVRCRHPKSGRVRQLLFQKIS